jgi:hypothetical protein
MANLATHSGTKNCAQCTQQFEITEEDLKLLKQLSPVIGVEQYALPLPTLCPLCRHQNHLLFRNERMLYNRKSDLSGKAMISIFAPDSEFKAFDQDEWWSDKWDPMAYGRDFDFNKTLTEQLNDLNHAVPHMGLSTKKADNSIYTNFAVGMKNSYLVFGAADDEDCLYDNIIFRCRDVVDSLSIYDSELCYEGVGLRNCYRCSFLSNCRNCSDSMFMEECENCKNCLLCFGLRNAEYYYMNQFVGEEKIAQLRKELACISRNKIDELRDKFNVMKNKLPHIYSHIYGSEGCTGDIISNSKNCNWSFDVGNSENCSYIYGQKNSVNSMDITYAALGVRYCYQLCSATGCEKSIGCFLCWDCYNTFYSIECQNTSDVFACVGLRRKKHCILNKQYSKEEYANLVSKVIVHMQKTGEWGEFLSKSLSHFAYNETVANEHFPLNKRQVIDMGLRWKDRENICIYQGEAKKVPDSIQETTEDIVKEIFQCEDCRKNYKLVGMELKFYKKMNIPLPKKCFGCRNRARYAQCNPRRLWLRECSNCQAQIKTTYAPGRPETVYCEKCYLKEVY